jgi:TatD DNase family protein
VVPDCRPLTDADREILAAADAHPCRGTAAMTRSHQQGARRDLAVVADANRYFAAQEPWALKKTDPARMATVLYVTAEVLRIIGIMCQPYIPSSAATLLQLLGVENHARSFADLGTRLASGTPLPAPQPSSRAMSRKRWRKREHAGVDSHCHLDFDGMDEKLPDVLARAEARASGLMVSISSRVRSFGNLLRIAEENPNVFCTVGTHPHNAHEELDGHRRRTRRLARAPEMRRHRRGGLDYHYDLSPREAQEANFFVHIACRPPHRPSPRHPQPRGGGRYDIDLAGGMGRGGHSSRAPLLHVESEAGACRGVAMGGYVSFSGILTYKSAEDIRATAAELPLDRIIVETDSPYLSPVPLSRKTQRTGLFDKNT